MLQKASSKEAEVAELFKHQDVDAVNPKRIAREILYEQSLSSGGPHVRNSKKKPMDANITKTAR